MKNDQRKIKVTFTTDTPPVLTEWCRRVGEKDAAGALSVAAWKMASQRDLTGAVNVGCFAGAGLGHPMMMSGVAEPDLIKITAMAMPLSRDQAGLMRRFEELEDYSFSFGMPVAGVRYSPTVEFFGLLRDVGSVDLDWFCRILSCGAGAVVAQSIAGRLKITIDEVAAHRISPAQGARSFIKDSQRIVRRLGKCA